jgi:hypothetical protein
MSTMGAYFTADGNPTREAQPFFEYCFATDEAKPGPEFHERKAAVAGKRGHFTDELILQSLIEGWSVAETILRGQEPEIDLAQQRSHRYHKNAKAPH